MTYSPRKKYPLLSACSLALEKLGWEPLLIFSSQKKRMCGIIGAVTHQPVALDLYDGLLMLQHRGQDAAGIATFDGEFFRVKRGGGLVKDIFDQSDIEYLSGNLGIGHVRYPTAGTLSLQEAQPFFVNSPLGIYLVHNGNLVNAKELRQTIQSDYHRHLQTHSDSELMINVLAHNLSQAFRAQPKASAEDQVVQAVTSTMQQLQGAYASICLIDSVGLVGFRDPNAIRPLSLGRRQTTRGDEWMMASEDVAFYAHGFEKVDDLEPGEIVIISPQGEIRRHIGVKGEKNPCIFEYIYLARPDSIIDGISVYKTQLRLGKVLAQKIKELNLEIDTVMPVPDSSRPAALEIASHLGVKYREGLVKNRYIGRTFIMPEQQTRKKSVQQKLNVITLEFKNRNVLLVDDSIVRGTTMRQIVELCRRAGVKKLYVASTAPPVRYQNVYGIDMPTQDELVAAQLSIPEIQEVLGCDGLFYQSLEDLIWAVQEGNPGIHRFDCSCFNGEYLAGEVTAEYLQQLNQKGRKDREQQLPLGIIS